MYSCSFPVVHGTIANDAMRWLATRIALAVAFWILCSGSLSSEGWPSGERPWKVRGGDDLDHGGMNSTAESTNDERETEQITDTSDARETKQITDMCLISRHFLRVRGGQDSSFLSDLLANTTVTMEEERVAEELTQEEEQDTASFTLSRKVTERLRRWKERRSNKQDFLDRMALVSSTLLRKERDAALDKEEEVEKDDAITHQSDLTRPGRYFTIVTTAALPWMTGTAVNPLLRSAYLVRKTREINLGEPPQQRVTLVVPWLELEEDQQELYGRVFGNEQEQEDYIRTWLRNDADMPDAANPKTGLKIR